MELVKQRYTVVEPVIDVDKAVHVDSFRASRVYFKTNSTWYELHQVKTHGHARTAKAQFRLRICAV